MEDRVRRELAELVRRFGVELCNDPRRCESLLRDVCGDGRQDVAMLVNAAREGVANELRYCRADMPKDVVFARLTRQLCENCGLSEDWARWAVETWAFALGVTVPQELAEWPARAAPTGHRSPERVPRLAMIVAGVIIGASAGVGASYCLEIFLPAALAVGSLAGAAVGGFANPKV